MAVTLPPNPDFADILKSQETYASGSDDNAGDQINSWFDRLMLQAGISLAPSMVLALCMCAGIALAALVWVLQENLLTTALAGFIGFLAPILITMFVRARRQKKMLDQMPAMIDELSRAARTGRSLENCLQIVAEDTPAPLGSELKRCTQQIELGLPLEEALTGFPERTGLVSASVFTTALSIHRQTGGNLVQVLERLSQTLRDRIQFQGRLRAATAASKLTAVLMVIVPPAILLFFIFRDPGYFQKLMETDWARMATIFAVILEIIGIFLVFRILKTSEQA